MHAPAPVNRLKVWQDKLTRSGYFFGAILLHLVVFLLVSTLVIWKAPPPPPVEFQAISTAVVKPPPPPPIPANTGTAAANPEMDPQNVVVPPVSLPTAITTANLSSSTVDPAKTLSATLSNLSDLLPQGSGSGPAGSGLDSGKNGFWGQLEQGASTGLEGTFYDFTRTQDGKDTGMTADTYIEVVKAFCKDFTPPEKYPCYTSSVHLSSKLFFFPPIPDNQAGQAFQTPSSTEAFWIAHYHGSFTVDAHGRYRLVGFADNVLVVRINNQIVLEASDYGFDHKSYLGLDRKSEGDGAQLPGKDSATPLYMGDSFDLDPGVTNRIDIVVGDEGGIFCAGLFLAPDNPSITFNTNGTPKLPLMFFGALAEPDKQTLLQFLAPECVTSPVTFTVVPETSTSL